MLSAAILVHRNILSAQCYIWYCSESHLFDALEFDCCSNELCITVLHKNSSVHQCRILIPEHLFQPLSLSTSPKRIFCSCSEICKGSQFNKQLSPIASLPELRNDKEFAINSSDFLAKETNLGLESCNSLCNCSDLSTYSINAKDNERISTTLPTFITNELASSSCIENHDEQSTNSISVEELKIIEHFHAELSFRLQISKIDYFERSPLDSTNIPISVKNFLYQQVRVDSPCKIVCTNCNKALTSESLSFQKIEECCDGLISELSESWFCHAKTAHTVDLATKSLYFDSVSFYLHHSIIETLSIEKKRGHGYVCNACSSVLVEDNKLIQGFVRFYCDRIMFQNPECAPVNCSSYRLQIAWISLWNLIQSNQKMSLDCKLYLQSKNSEGETSLLLRVMLEKVPLFLLRGNVPTQVDFKPDCVHKVLYYIGTSSSEMVQSWRHDFSADFYKVSDSMMRIYTEFLTASSKYIPGGSTTVAGLLHGCLPTQFPKF